VPSNGRTHGNAYLITFKVGLLRASARTHTHTYARTHTHTHTCSIDPAIVGSTGGRLHFGSSGARPSHSISWPAWLRNCLLEAQFQSREQPRVTRSEIRRVGWLGDDTTSDVRYREAEATVPACLLSRRFLCKTCTVTLCPGGTNSWRTKPSMAKNSGNFLTAPRIISYIGCRRFPIQKLSLDKYCCFLY
jgi:hypothetical protein